jgi:hypothetical protein
MHGTRYRGFDLVFGPFASSRIQRSPPCEVLQSRCESTQLSLEPVRLTLGTVHARAPSREMSTPLTSIPIGGHSPSACMQARGTTNPRTNLVSHFVVHTEQRPDVVARVSINIVFLEHPAGNSRAGAGGWSRISSLRRIRILRGCMFCFRGRGGYVR